MSSKFLRYHNWVLFMSSLAMLLACNSKTDKQARKTANVELPDNAALAANQQQQKDSVICVRGQAEPVVKKKYFPITNFILQSDSLSAIETVSFKNGDKLIITNWGCESYVVTFRFETSRFNANNTEIKYWYAAAGKLMSEVIPGIDAPIDLRQGVRALHSYATKNTKQLRLQTELNFGGDEAIRIVTLDSIAKIKNNRTAVTISFTAGLL